MELHEFLKRVLKEAAETEGAMTTSLTGLKMAFYIKSLEETILDAGDNVKMAEGQGCFGLGISQYTWVY